MRRIRTQNWLKFSSHRPSLHNILPSPPPPLISSSHCHPQGFVNQEAVLTLVSRRLGDFLGDKATASEAVPSAFYGISEGAILGAGYSEFSSIVSENVRAEVTAGLKQKCKK